MRTAAKTARHAIDLEAFREDFDTAWVPDVLGEVDYEATAAWPLGSGSSYSDITVPRPSDTPMQVFVVPFGDRVLLHDAVKPIREAINAKLAPGVCGYRKGAEAQSYRVEFARFRGLVEAGIENARIIFRTDVSRFFSSVSPSRVVEAAREIAGPGLKQLIDMLNRFHVAGVVGIPAGYADARLLANAVLDEVDASIDAPFARWVDDYRVFTGNLAEAETVKSRMRTSLQQLGLNLNEAKSEFLDQQQAREKLLGRSLESVYHPDAEPSEHTRAALRTAFSEGAASPISNRRLLRFSLLRLGGIRDDVAIDFALKAIFLFPWEAPRLVTYLSTFMARQTVQQRVLSAFSSALDERNDWLVARLSPLACQLTDKKPGIHVARDYVKAVERPAPWGLAIRFLSLAEDKEFVVSHLRERRLDPRATLGAMRDLEGEPSASMRREAPVTAMVLDQRPAPPPRAYSIL